MPSALTFAKPFSVLCCLVALACRASAAEEPKPVAAIVTSYFHNSHADVIVSRLLEGYTLNGQGERPNLKVVSLYTDQVPANDKSRKLAEIYGFKIYDNVADALTLASGKLAVEGVLLVAEHGDYPLSPTGQIVYPKRRLFEQIAAVFRASGRAVPVFCDKHLADNWDDARWLYDTAKELGTPLMAGSSLPVLWRYPPTDVEHEGKLQELLGVSYHTLDTYGFHGLEMLQCLAERRAGGETGVRAVTCLVGKPVWEAAGKLYDSQLFQAAMGRLRDRRGGDKPLAEIVPEPVLFHIEYADGLRSNLLTLNGAVAEWAAAWRYADGRTDSTLFWTQEARPVMHFTYLVKGIDSMIGTGRPAWPVQRTLLTSGCLNLLMTSKQRGGERLETPQLLIPYRSDWKWQQPPEPPPGRPFTEQ